MKDMKIITDKVEIKDERDNTMDILSDIDIMGQLEEGKKKVTKVRDFEDLAKEFRV